MGLFVGTNEPSKIFVGDTPISKVFLGDTQVRPEPGPRNPGANTLAYRPLTSDFNDHSGNGYHLTNLNNATVIQTKDGVSCAYTNGSNAGLYTSALNASIIGQDFTCSFYGNSTTWTGVHCGKGSGYSWAGWNIDINQSQNLLYGEILNGNPTSITKTTTISSGWHNVILTHNSNGATSLYLDGVLQNTASLSMMADSYGVGINYNNAEIGAEVYYLGWIGKVIIENKKWTDQEVADYYDQTKSDYGL